MLCRNMFQFIKYNVIRRNLSFPCGSKNYIQRLYHNRLKISPRGCFHRMGLFNINERLFLEKHSRIIISSEKKLSTVSETNSQEKNVPVAERVNVVFVSPEGEEIKVQGKVGDNVLELGCENDVGCEGACEGQLACTTCHVYVDDNYSQYITEPVSEEEDLLDNAPFLKPNSRLCCQLHLTKELEGIRFTIPQATVNFFVDGHKPTKH